MKKDFTYVAITFSLIGSMVFGGAFLYSKKMYLEKAIAQIIQERELYAEALKAAQLAEQTAAEQRLKASTEDELERQNELRIAKIQKQSLQTKAQLQEQQAALARQQATATLATQPQPVAVAVVQPQNPIRPSRQSRAS